MIDFQWFSEHGKSFTDFAKIIGGHREDEVYSSELVQTTLEYFWENWKRDVIVLRILPVVAMALVHMI